MTIEEQLKQRILDRYKSVRAFTTQIGIPYSTLDSVFRRGIGKAGIETMLKVFGALDLDIESVPSGELSAKRHEAKPAAPKTDTAENIAKRYKKLDNHGKRAVCAIIAEEEFRMIDSRSETKKSAPEESEADMIYSKAIAKNGQITPFCVRRGQDKEILEEAKKRVTTDEDSGLD